MILSSTEKRVQNYMGGTLLNGGSQDTEFHSVRDVEARAMASITLVRRSFQHTPASWFYVSSAGAMEG